MRAILKGLVLVVLLAGCASLALADEAKHRFTLVIDAGHGGHDPGAIGSFSKEKDINLSVALAFGKLVEDNCSDVKVVYTRKRDVFVPLQRRADLANDHKADLFVSIHTNALPGGKAAYGSETYSLGMARANENLAVAKRENAVITLESDYQRTYEGFAPDKAESYVIFEIMQDRYMRQSVDLAQCIQKQYKRAGRPDKGVHQAGFLVLRNTSMPSVLTELGFISTPAEEQYLNSPKGVSELSRSLYNGFLAYRRLHDRTAHDLPPDLPTLTADRPTHSSTEAESDEEVAVVPVPTVPTARRTDAKPAPAAQSKPAGEQADGKPEAGQKPSSPAKKQAAPKAKQSPTTSSKQADSAKKPAEPEKKPAAKDKQPAAKDKPQASSKPAQKKQSAAKGPKVQYRVQVGAGKRDISPKDSQFKGLAVTRVKEGSLYKFFYGNYSTYAEAKKGLRTVQAKMPEAYLVAYVDGKPVSVADARKQEK
ncbi:MAG: N-acetylmuramoyl-L-alanine amidase [Bacteroidales bacterium]|nr:N-acetylmuramoyl-L-alanine amidase [Bacteroidales bacterium]